MATPPFRYQLHLHGAQLIRLALVAGLLAVLPLAAQAQRKARARVNRSSKGVVKSVTVQNLPGYDVGGFTRACT